jgi:hypothetical protein
VFIKDANGEHQLSRSEFEEHHARYQPSGSQHAKEGMSQRLKDRMDMYMNTPIPIRQGESRSDQYRGMLSIFADQQFPYESREDKQTLIDQVIGIFGQNKATHKSTVTKSRYDAKVLEVPDDIVNAVLYNERPESKAHTRKDAEDLLKSGEIT